MTGAEAEATEKESQGDGERKGVMVKGRRGRGFGGGTRIPDLFGCRRADWQAMRVGARDETRKMEEARRQTGSREGS